MTEVDADGFAEPTEEEIGAMADFEVSDPTEELGVEEEVPDGAQEGEQAPDLSTGAVEGDEAQATPEGARTEPGTEGEGSSATPAGEKAPDALVEPAAALAEPASEPQAPAPVAAGPTAEEKEAQIQEIRQDLLKRLTDEFDMSEEEELEFATSPRSFLAKMNARNRLESYEATFYAVMNQIPTMFANQQTATTEQDALETAFYERWPALQDGKHTTQVIQAVQLYRSMNPTATPELVRENAGAMVSHMLGLASQPAAPATALAPENGRRVISRTPYAPSGPGAAGTEPAPKKNEWEQLADWDRQDV